MFLEWIPHVVVLLGLPGLPRTGTLHSLPPHLEPFHALYGRTHFHDCGRHLDHLFLLHPSHARRTTRHPGNRIRLGVLHHQLCDSHSRHLPSFHVYRTSKGASTHNRHVETELWNVSDAHLLARPVGNSVQANRATPHRCRHPLHCSKHIHQLLPDKQNHFISPRK